MHPMRSGFAVQWQLRDRRSQNARGDEYVTKSKLQGARTVVNMANRMNGLAERRNLSSAGDCGGTWDDAAVHGYAEQRK